MKINKRWFLGVVSTFLLAVGLVRAADRLDPVNRDLNAMDKAMLSAVDRPAPDCMSLCAIAERPAPDCMSLCAIAHDGK
ncbi:MAG: hypothetical protein Q7S40_24050 [Opitutaceae bacterium]|nr:hypothetical protein [Opitutaceae bacterium]